MEKFVSRPLFNESPASYADRLSLEYSSKVTQEHKKRLGQFFTPLSVASFMSEFSNDIKTNKIKILDPGCGTGVLACAVIEALVRNNSHLEEIDLIAFETDLELLVYTDASLNYLQGWLRKKNIKFSCFLCKNDFILHNSSVLSNKNTVAEKYNIIIANPPYFKISKNDERAKAAHSVIFGQSNIYSIFLLIAAKMLDEQGKLIFITPRSFSSGTYFKLFREKFFELVNLTNIHLFVSRKEAFERDNVLQENIIVVATKKKIAPSQFEIFFPNYANEYLQISTSKGINDVAQKVVSNFRFSDLVNLQSDQKIIHIPTSKNDEAAIQLFKTWSCTLSDHDLRISTGPVVDFRNLDFIRDEPEKSTVPLVYLHNVNKMSFAWPAEKNKKGKAKGEYIVYNTKSFSRLVLNKDYVFLRRFSSKDDRSRLIACPYFSKWLPQYSMLGIENHLNYIYRKDGHLSCFEVVGLAGLLNSKLFDIYFRTFNGNINVSATELRHLPLPSKPIIEEIGKTLINEGNPNQEFIDRVVQYIFKIQIA